MKAVYRFFYHLSILLTFVLAGVTLAGAFAGRTHPESSAIVSFIGLALPALLLVNLAVSLYWLLRWRYWAVIPLVAIFGNWSYLSRIIQYRSSPEMEVASKLLTIATYNVNSFNFEPSGASCKAIAQYMHKQRADILCLQEFAANRYFNEDSIRNALREWPYSYIPQAPEGQEILQIAVFSKYPISEQRELITYPNSKNCSSWCDITIDGRTIRLFNNHLQTTEVSQKKRKIVKQLRDEQVEAGKQAVYSLMEGLHENLLKRTQQAALLNKLIYASPYPTLSCGDLNSLPSSNIYCLVKGAKQEDGFQSCGHGYMYTFRYFKHLLRIDYIFHSPDLKGVDYYSDDLIYSDHNPVVMKVKM